MVELSDPKGPVKEGIDNTIFIVPGLIILTLVRERGLAEGKQLIPAARTIDITKAPFSCAAFLWFIAVFFVPGALMGFFVYRLVMSLREKEKQKEEKKKVKLQRKEKETARKQKKR